MQPTLAFPWYPLTSVAEVDQIIARSFATPCLIFKHSTRCEVSSIAKYRLESDWFFPGDEIEPHYLDLLAYRSVSEHVAETFQVHHESPQMLLIVNGACAHDASHLDISIAEIKEALEYADRR